MNPIPITTITSILLSILLLSLAGCTSQPILPEPLPQKQISTLTEHQQQLKDLRSWKIKGRLAISYNGDSWNASIHWQKHAENYDIQLFLPLGQGSMHLNGDVDGATLKTSDGEQFMAENGELLFYQQFGLAFPVDALHKWVTGRPDTKDGNWLQQVDEHGQMVSLNQDNWNLRLPKYQNVSTEISTTNHKTVSLPQKIFLQQNGKSVRLVIQQWQLNDQ